MSSLEDFYDQLEEPNKSCFLALRSIILKHNSNITEALKWNLPTYYYNGKLLGYLWKDKKTNHPYIGVHKGKLIDHPALELGNRKQIKTFSIDPNKDIEIETLQEILNQAIALY